MLLPLLQYLEQGSAMVEGGGDSPGRRLQRLLRSMMTHGNDGVEAQFRRLGGASWTAMRLHEKTGWTTGSRP